MLAPINMYVICLFICLLVSVFSYFSFAYFSSFEKKEYKFFEIKEFAPERVLYVWRVKRIFYRERVFSFLLFSTFFCLFGVGFLGFKLQEDFFLMTASYALGFVLGSVICFQITEEFKSIWLERNAGVSHKNYMKSLQLLTHCIGLCGIGSLSLGLFLSFFLFGESFNGESFVFLVKAGALVYVPVWLVNCIALQLDPRNAQVQVIILFLLSLFLCTAIMINLLFILLCFGFHIYGQDSQKNRFYNI